MLWVKGSEAKRRIRALARSGRIFVDDHAWAAMEERCLPFADLRHALECMPQIGKRDAALLHRGPGMIVDEDSATARKGPDSALRFRSLHPQHDRGRLVILSSLGVLLRSLGQDLDNPMATGTESRR